MSNRCCTVKIANCTSSVAKLRCGVPQGSILAPIIFSLYMPPLGNIFREHGVSIYCFVYDIQIYLPLKKGDTSNFEILAACLNWMSLNFLHLKEFETEIVVFDLAFTLAATLKAKLTHL